ncbi:hypothetical protein MPHO_38050 [Mycolicibacterium phocaicum]|nr:hypothetical protein MPHO_38050 [Mycolicibacterium phocaicum]
MPMLDGADTISAVGVTAMCETGRTGCSTYAQKIANGTNTVNARCTALHPSLPIRPATKAPSQSASRAAHKHRSIQIYVRGR